MNEDGAETLYRIRIDEPAVNVGAAVIASSPGSLVHPWVLGSPDENDVQGYAGTPVNVNNLTLDFPLDIGAAATVFPRTKAYYVAVDSGRDQFTGRSLAGDYVLRAWVNDVQPPLLGLITSRVAAGRPTLAAARARSRRRASTRISLVIGYGRALIARRGLRPGQRHRALPAAARGARAARGETLLSASAADFQEAKNVDSVGDELLPNTAFASGNITVVERPGDHLGHARAERVRRRPAQLLVLASSTAALRSVRFLDGSKPIATVRRGVAGIYSAAWKRGGAAKGRHTLQAIVTDAKGRQAEAQRVVRVCK